MANPMDQIIAKGAGLAHDLEARMHGLVGVFETLSRQHAEAASLLERAKADENKRPQLWPTIRASLMAHEQGELREVYPELRNYPELVALADRHEVEATQLSKTIEQMDGYDPGSGHFAVLLDQLIGLVKAHASEEETQIFPRAQRAMGQATAEALDPKFQATAKQIKEAQSNQMKS